MVFLGLGVLRTPKFPTFRLPRHLTVLGDEGRERPDVLDKSLSPRVSQMLACTLF